MVDYEVEYHDNDGHFNVTYNEGSGGGAVTSVNGQTGDVVIDIPENTSDLNNDSGFITSEDIPPIPSVPVISTDIEADATSNTKTISPKAVKDYVDEELDEIWSIGSSWLFGLASDIEKKVSKEAQAAKTAEMTEPVGIDENGKLWSKPGSGGGGGDTPFRLINTITVSEDVNLLAITQDSNGDSFSLKEIWLEFELPARAEEKVLTIMFGINNPSSLWRSISELVCTYKGVTNKSWLRVHMELKGGVIFSDAEYGSAVSIYTPAPASSAIAKDVRRIGGNYTEYGIARNAITSFEVYYDDGVKTLANTVIKMWGR